MAKFINNRNNGLPAKKAASTVFNVGDFIYPDGSGAYVPAIPDVPLYGVTNEEIQSTDADYATVRPFQSISTPVNLMDELEIPVITGTATVALEGTLVDIDSGDSSGVDVTAPGTQIYVTKFIDVATIHGVMARLVTNQKAA